VHLRRRRRKVARPVQQRLGLTRVNGSKEAKQIVLENYASQPVLLQAVRRQPSK
jgi:hypothetical protein